MTTLLAITYPESDRAEQAMESIEWSEFDRLINLKAACWIAKDNGELKVHPHHQTVGKAALGGALGLLIGGLFAIPVVGIAAGAAVGIHKGHQKESGIDKAFIASIGERLKSGESAIFILIDGGADTTKAASDLTKYGGTIQSTDLSPERLAQFQALLDKSTPSAESPDHRAASS